MVVGEIRLFSHRTVPAGWLICDGQALKIQQHLMLYLMIGDQYGKTEKDAFLLPKMEAPEQMVYCIAVQGELPE